MHGRQDVNLSIEGGSRVELKGFQNIREMDKAIINEARRQLPGRSLIQGPDIHEKDDSRLAEGSTDAL